MDETPLSTELLRVAEFSQAAFILDFEIDFGGGHGGWGVEVRGEWKR